MLLVTLIVMLIVYLLYSVSFLQLYRKLREHGITPKFLNPVLWFPLNLIFTLWVPVNVARAYHSAGSLTLTSSDKFTVVLIAISALFSLLFFVLGLVSIIIIEVIRASKGYGRMIEEISEKYEDLTRPLRAPLIIWIIGFILLYGIVFPLYLMRRFAEFDMLQVYDKLRTSEDKAG